MTLRLRRLSMRAITPAGPYGTDVKFGPGLNVIWADNTKGKSTCIQGMLYALGMEKMLSPRREVPLPHAMTSYIRNNDESTAVVLTSRVSLEIQNGAGQIVTIHRPVKVAGVDNRLITVDFGPTLSDPMFKGVSRNFFVLDPGAANREDGFHRFLEDFLGWSLPLVRRYDSPEGKLYLETVFPLFWVEQKAGWSAIPAAIPTYLRIREVQKRAVEFLLDLDIHKIEIERQRLQDSLDANSASWNHLWEELDRYARRNGGKLEGLPQRPTLVLEDLSAAHLVVVAEGEWIRLQDLLKSLRARVAQLEAAPVPAVGPVAEELSRELDRLQKSLENTNRERIELFKAKQLKDADVSSLKRRIQSVNDDLQKNQDVQKLQRYSGSSATLTPDRCPTCEQALADSLLSQTVLAAVMPIGDNIEYLKSQLRMFQSIQGREEAEQAKLEARRVQLDRQLNEIYARIRSVRADLVAPASNPSAVAIEDRVRTEGRIRELEAFQSVLDETVGRMLVLAKVALELTESLSVLPKDRLSEADRSKFAAFTTILRQQVRDFGFSTFNPDELTIDADSYRPQKEGFEIGFEISASDAIRLKWAYQLGMLELSHSFPTNHPGMLLLDEPRQQSSSKVSFGRLLERSAGLVRNDQQVIISTSEELGTLKQIVSGIGCDATFFEGYILQPLGGQA